MTSTATGRLLVATPAISDGIFDRAVVFVLHHDPVGALGVIISDPTELLVGDLLPRWAGLCVEPSVIFGGGPVEPNGFLGVGRSTGARDPEIATPVGNSELVSVDLDADPAIAQACVDRLRIFRGYAGWAPGQLDNELRHGGWFSVDATPSDLWSEDPGSLYEHVLRRQPGKLRWFANAPVDPQLN